jgi:dolichyl-diphosphooligosaccharide--protein glycosyltransferase
MLIALAFATVPVGYKSFHDHCEQMAHAVSNPRIIIKAQLRNGENIMIDDYREAYFWLRDKTPQDSRVMAWWDYGYQITGIGNRTSIADGNTWNHEHIATLGKCLTSPVPEAHSLIRHLADYVLVWAGGGGDDLAKSPHMARIGNSVYHDICPKEDPLCSHFGFYDREQMKPTSMMEKSLLYNLAMSGMGKANVDQKLFKEVLKTKYGKVRIFKVMNVSQESKDWVADPANRICDAPGSWYCNGQYPPAPEIQALLRKRTDFGQLEDFNKASKKNDEYHKNYMKKMREQQGH